MNSLEQIDIIILMKGYDQTVLECACLKKVCWKKHAHTTNELSIYIYIYVENDPQQPFLLNNKKICLITVDLEIAQ